jgi:hypothetical protein
MRLSRRGQLAGAVALVASIAAVLLLTSAIGSRSGTGGSRTHGSRSAPDHRGASTQPAPVRQATAQRPAKPGRIDSRAKTLHPTTSCTRARSTSPPYKPTLLPPIPELSAARDGSHIVVRFRFRVLPRTCRPLGLVITANSVDQLANVSTASKGHPSAATRSGTISMPVPPNGPPPYEARLSALAAAGGGTPVTTVAVQ